MTITVFIADDHAVLRDGLRALLEATGDIEVIGEAENGRDAVRFVEEHQPDVALMDISMPELNGIEATKQITKNVARTRVVMLSMHEDPEYVFRAFQAGASGYLLKESAGRDVVAAVREAASGKTYVSKPIADMLISTTQAKKPQDESSPLECLTLREREILQMVVEGNSNRDISKALSISVRSVETYRSRIMQKLGVYNVPDLVKLAIRHGITSVN
ncbi:MAG: response regulator transcription factor [Chlorobi bacterium]|nr:response regulator transcription factor [Chlorobiota bacterium]